MKIVEAIHDYISKCPYIKEFEVNVNYLEAKYDSYMIEETPGEPILRRYIDGTTLRQIEFVFASREVYTSDILSNIDNSSFYEDFSNWIETNNINGVFPDLEEGLEATKIKVTSNAYCVEADEDNARYQINLRLEYMKGSR